MKTHGIAMALVTALSLAAASTGCAVSSPAPEANAGAAGETSLMNEESQSTLPGVSMRVEQKAGESAFSVVEGADWRPVAPGVWENGDVAGVLLRLVLRRLGLHEHRVRGAVDRGHDPVRLRSRHRGGEREPAERHAVELELLLPVSTP